MLALGLALLCFQACLVETVFGQIACVRSPFDYAPSLWANVGEFGFPGYGYPQFNRGLFTGRYEFGYGAYGGEGVGEVSVAGELPAGGATEVAGQVPILGAVEFAGPVKAAGTITISGTCGCGCGFLL